MHIVPEIASVWMTSGEYKASSALTRTSGWLSGAAARETQTSCVADGSSDEPVQRFFRGREGGRAKDGNL